MTKKINVSVTKPQYTVATDVSFAQVDYWYGHTRMDLKMDIIYPEDKTKKYPCIVWICGGGFLTFDKSAHLVYLSQLAREGFVVASISYRTSNIAQFPSAVCDVKAAIRYLRAYAERYNIDKDRFGVSGESAGGYLALMAALDKNKEHEVGEYLDESSAVQACLPWYPVVNMTTMDCENEVDSGRSYDSLMMGFNVFKEKERAIANCPISMIKKDAPPIMIIHGNSDKTVPFKQSLEIEEALEKEGAEISIVEIDGADHADVMFFQDEVWDIIIDFYKNKLGNPTENKQ